jgi:hypothetical protein
MATHYKRRGTQDENEGVIGKIQDVFLEFCRQPDLTPDGLRQALGAQNLESGWELHVVIAKGDQGLNFEKSGEVGRRYFIVQAAGGNYLLP